MGLPIEIDPLLMSGAAGSSISKSLRFRAASSANLNRTFAASPTVQTKQTISVWVKRGYISSAANNNILSGYDGTSTNQSLFYILPNDTLALVFGGSALNQVASTQVLRDPSAWYHVVASIDTTQATAANRAILYINGVQVTSYSVTGYPSQNSVTQFALNNANNRIGSNFGASGGFLDGYLAEVNFIDGQALTPSSFGAYDTNGVWQPLKYRGTYGTNGFYLPFTNTTRTATLGNDFSGNGNTWTVNNISLTAGVTYDSMVDSPTVSSTSVANYPVLNALTFSGAAALLQDGNLSWREATGTASWKSRWSTMAPPSGKWYAEITCTYTGTTALGTNAVVGLHDGLASTTFCGLSATSYGYNSGGTKYNNNVSTSYGASWANNDLLQIAYDADNKKLWFGKNGVWQASGDPAAGTNAAFTSVSANLFIGVSGFWTSPDGTLWLYSNFGQRPLTYTPPSGFNPLNTYNLPSPTIPNGAQYMAATTYSGNGTSQSVNNAGNNTIGTTFQPDFVWVKVRDAAGLNHILANTVAGITNFLNSNTSNAESSTAGYITSSNSNGFSVGSAANVNQNGNQFIGWQWKAGGSGGVSNTNGSITSTVSANQAVGFSIVTYTGTGANATVGHGLGTVPNMLLIKKRSGTTANWAVYHSAVGNSAALSLNQATGTNTTSAFWQNTTPTSTVFSVGTSGDNNPSGATLVAYCWSAVSGYSAFGSYTGNGNADGPFIYCGFKPRFVLIKIYSTTGDWYLWDTSRSTFNVVSATLLTDSAAAETSATSIDILSNGFKCRSATVVNASAATYAYAAFAENPFQISRAQ